MLYDAWSYFERGAVADQAIFEHGDALEIAEAYDQRFDVVVLDHDTAMYPEGFDAVRESVVLGGVIVADNVVATADGLTADDLLTTLDGNPASTDRARYTADYYEYLRAGVRNVRLSG